MKVVPVGPAVGSALDSTMMLPRCIFTIPWVTAKPSPVPIPTCLVVKNGSNSLAICSSAMPSPVSETWMVTDSGSSLRVMVSSPPSGMAC